MVIDIWKDLPSSLIDCLCISEVYKTLPPVRTKTELIDREAMGRARFMVYTGFIFFFRRFDFRKYIKLIDSVKVTLSISFMYFRYYKICCIKITSQCKILIVPEEGWFGQPKYSTHSKIILRCVGFCFYFLNIVEY